MPYFYNCKEKYIAQVTIFPSVEDSSCTYTCSIMSLDQDLH